MQRKNLKIFRADIWKDNPENPQRKSVNKVVKKIDQKVTNVQEFTITEKKLYKTVKRPSNCSAPGIDRVQNFWWKRFRGSWSVISKFFNQCIEQSDEIPDWLTQRQTVLLLKT